MKKGKWNYTEHIQYKVVLVKLLPVPETPMHWQNAFAGQERQVVWINYDFPGETPFLIDNQDGSGLLKISRGGGPDSYSAHIGHYEFIRDLPESEWISWSKVLHDVNRKKVDDWQEEHFPEEFARMNKLRQAIQSRDFHVDKNGTIQLGKKQ